ncbi:UTP--glucose-1-phosphate uridylyltransferase [Bartonella doshiae]|uniref:UTP--glucose-1-phosphate uridylyltransferase n=2 Tax=Bartonella doshiae TaxID=33044 RepID=A0A380ZDT2_BARDO|nr:hypothetical protein MCS_00497 [Bartonella doshiae NCTC 12862 = ATCC 700133]SUV44502.1 UTP--glucose-1-phosphate uridylyltransferase [Bartonella doshiae]
MKKLVGVILFAVQECDPSEAHEYGIVGKGKQIASGFEITKMVEKPTKGTAPSNLYINGRYILQPEIFNILSNQERGAGDEIQLTDAMMRFSNEQDFFGFQLEGLTFDCGSKVGFIEANVVFSLARADMHSQVSASLKNLLETIKIE